MAVRIIGEGSITTIFNPPIAVYMVHGFNSLPFYAEDTCSNIEPSVLPVRYFEAPDVNS